MIKSNEKYTILYARLSQEDSRDGVSNSIENQKMILEKYANDNGFCNCKFMSDDGFSGTNFSRPAWQEVMKLIENGEVQTLIVKDLSRLGRDYLEVGRLTEIIFPNYDVRFITTNDGIDTLYGLDDFTPFKAVIAELYAKDCSKKIRAVKKAKAEKGEMVASRPAFGYKKCADNPKKIEPDLEAAETVKRIFKLCIEGKGPSQIAKILEKEERINPPTSYFNRTEVVTSGYHPDRPFKWKDKTISRIIANEIYVGHTINLKTTRKSYKNKKKMERPKEEWLRFENTHEAIISAEDWAIAQEVRRTKKRPRKNMDEPNIFSGLIFCANCGKYLVLHRAHTMDEKKNNFACSTYKKDTKKCTTHYISEHQLATIVLDDLKRVTHFARMKESEFAVLISQKITAETRNKIKNIEKQLVVLQKRNAELDVLFKKLFEKYASEQLPEDVYSKLSADYLAEQKQISEEIPKLELEKMELKNTLANADNFIAKAKKYGDEIELSGEILRQFISKIVVHEREQKRSRTANQKIEIHYRDIGYLGDYTKETDIEPPIYEFKLTKQGELVAV